MSAQRNRQSEPERQSLVKIDPQRRIVISTFFGKITDELLLRHGRGIAEHEDFNPRYAEIVDFSAAQPGSIADATLARIAAARSIFHESVPHVIVAPNNDLAAIARKYQRISTESRPKLFVVRSLQEAYQLLALQGYR